MTRTMRRSRVSSPRPQEYSQLWRVREWMPASCCRVSAALPARAAPTTRSRRRGRPRRWSPRRWSCRRRRGRRRGRGRRGWWRRGRRPAVSPRDGARPGDAVGVGTVARTLLHVVDEAGEAAAEAGPVAGRGLAAALEGALGAGLEVEVEARGETGSYNARQRLGLGRPCRDRSAGDAAGDGQLRRGGRKRCGGRRRRGGRRYRGGGRRGGGRPGPASLRASDLRPRFRWTPP